MFLRERLGFSKTCMYQRMFLYRSFNYLDILPHNVNSGNQIKITPIGCSVFRLQWHRVMSLSLVSRGGLASTFQTFRVSLNSLFMVVKLAPE